jgi:molecular chaperone GrpE
MENNNTCGDNCGCKTTEKKSCSCKETISNLKEERDALNDKYLRLYAEFDNWKKRIAKDKEEASESVRLKTLNGVLDLNDDLHFAKVGIDKIADTASKEGLNLILDKFNKFITSQGIEEIQTQTYDSDLHEVVTVMPVGEGKIVEVLSKGYTLNGKVIRYPKIVLGT